MSAIEKPQTMIHYWCPKCGQNDRWGPLGSHHFSQGYRCAGKPERLTYTLAGAA